MALKTNKSNKKVSFSPKLSVVLVESFKQYNTMEIGNIEHKTKEKMVKCECIIY